MMFTGGCTNSSASGVETCTNLSARFVSDPRNPYSATVSESAILSGSKIHSGKRFLESSQPGENPAVTRRTRSGVEALLTSTRAAGPRAG